MKGFIAALLALTLMVGCGPATGKKDDNGGDDPPVGNKSDIKLTKFASCDEIKANIIANMERRLMNYNMVSCRPQSDEGILTEEPADVALAYGSALTYTDTNVQETGIDEADMIKTDGEFLYVTTADGIKIFRIWPFDEFSEIASVEIDGIPNSLYLIDNILLVFATKTGQTANAGNDKNKSQYGWTKKFTTASFVNVSNPADPKMLRESTYEGELISSRAIENMIHIAIQTTFDSEPELEYFVEDVELPFCEEGKNPLDYAPLANAVERLKQENIKKIENWDLPTSPVNAEHKYYTASEWREPQNVHCSDIMKSNAVNGDIFTAIISVNLNKLTSEDKISTAMGNSNTVYASTDSMYIASPRNIWGEDYNLVAAEETVIHRFKLGSEREDTTYIASTIVPGYLLNQFSMSEYSGHLRVATTYSSSNNVYTIDVNNPELPITGSVEDLAPGENIYAVRFVGPRGFVVTFKKVDPLFAIDLSDPANPQVKGELEIPGYSTYLHPYDDNNLIGIGFDADDMGSFAWFQGLQLSLFDVSNMSNPLRVHNIVIGTRGSNSEAVTDHHAFVFDGTRNLLSIPVDVAEGGKGGNNYGECWHPGMQVYRVGVDTGFELVGEIKREDLGCKSSWWTSTSYAKRSVILGNGQNEGLIVVWQDRVDLYNLSNTSLIGSANVNLPTNNW